MSSLATKRPSQNVISYPSYLSDASLAEIISLTFELTGISLNSEKRSMVYTRLLRRLRELEIPTFEDYLELLKAREQEELEVFVNVMTTNLTYFYRETHHFDFLEETVIPTMYAARASTSPLRIWSAGCSSGEEAYSIALTLAAAGCTDPGCYRLLCTDVNTETVARAEQGIYRTDTIRGLSSAQLQRCFDRIDEEHHKIKPLYQSNILCKPLNLFDRWPFAREVDVVFCRNVLIYFQHAQQDALIRRFAEFQPEGGYLFLGHSETVRTIGRYYQRAGNTVFRRLACGVE